MVDKSCLIELKGKIVDSKDADNFDDIIKCYEAGVLRAGFLQAWLMLIESLKRKVFELADKGVKIAIKEQNNIQKIEDAQKSNDEVIRQAALNCDLITKEEEGVVDLLWKKRCVMSHPYMPEIRECDFRYMVENLVSISLGKPLMWSQVMIDGYFEDIKTNIFLIPDTNEEKREQAGQIVALIPEKNWPYFWKTLFYELSLSMKDGSRKHKTMLRYLAISFLKIPTVDINDTKYTLANQIKNYCGVCWNIFFKVKAWDKLNDEYRGQLFRFLKDDKEEAKKVLFLVKELVECADLDEKYVNYYYEALANYDVTDMQRYYINKKLFLEVLYEDKIKGYLFAAQADFIDMLNSMNEDELNDYSKLQLQQLGRYTEKCCVNGTFKAQDFVRCNNIWTRNIEFAKGVALEGLSDEEGRLYVSKRGLEYVLPVLYRISEDNQLEVINELDKLPVVDTIKDEFAGKLFRMEVKKYFDEDSETGVALNGVINKYCLA